LEILVFHTDEKEGSGGLHKPLSHVRGSVSGYRRTERRFVREKEGVKEKRLLEKPRLEKDGRRKAVSEKAFPGLFSQQIRTSKHRS